MVELCWVLPKGAPWPSLLLLNTWRRDALEGKGPAKRPQKRLDRRLEKVAEAVGGGYCGFHTEAGTCRQGGQWLGVGWAPWEGGGGGLPPPFQCIPGLE